MAACEPGLVELTVTNLNDNDEPVEVAVADSMMESLLAFTMRGFDDFEIEAYDNGQSQWHTCNHRTDSA